MNLLHIKTNTVADFTGTVTVYNQTGGTQTVAATDLVRPSDWNSQHKMLLTFTGNTTGNSTVSGISIPISGAGGVSVGGSNGSFVISGLSDPGWLTTAALSNHSHNFATTTTGGALIVVGTTNSEGATIGVPSFLTTAQPVGAYLTTARASNDAVGLNTAATNVTWTVNSSGLSLNASGYAGTGTTFNGTNISGSLTQNSNGIRVDLSVGAGGAADGYNSVQFTNSTANSTMALLWAGNSNGSGNITLGLTGSTVTGSAPAGAGGGAAISAGANSQNTGTVVFSNSNGISFGLNAGTLTASHNGLTQQSTQPVAASAANGSYAFSTLAFINSNGVSWSTSTDGIRATVKTDYLTTARASNDAIGLNTALTANGVAWTVNSSGLSLNVPAFLTTAAQSGHSHGNPQLNLTNLSGTTASNSAGFTLSLSAGNYLTTAAASDHSHGNPTLALTNLTGTTASNSAGFTLSLSANAPGAAAENNWFNLAGNTAGNSTASGSTILLSAGANVTLSGTNGSVIRIDAGGGGGGATYNFGWDPYGAGGEHIQGQVGQSVIMFDRLYLPQYVSFNELVMPVYFTAATNSTGTATLSQHIGIYTQVNATQISLYTSFSGSTTVNHSGTQNSVSNVGGVRTWGLAIAATSLTPGQYIVGLMSMTASSSNNVTLSHYMVSGHNTAFSGRLGVATNGTQQYIPFRGRYTAATAAMPNSVAKSHISGTATSHFGRPVLWYLNVT